MADPGFKKRGMGINKGAWNDFGSQNLSVNILILKGDLAPEIFNF